MGAAIRVGGKGRSAGNNSCTLQSILTEKKNQQNEKFEPGQTNAGQTSCQGRNLRILGAPEKRAGGKTSGKACRIRVMQRKIQLQILSSGKKGAIKRRGRHHNPGGKSWGKDAQLRTRTTFKERRILAI